MSGGWRGALSEAAGWMGGVFAGRRITMCS
jgi:hypothetical protein